MENSKTGNAQSLLSPPPHPPPYTLSLSCTHTNAYVHTPLSPLLQLRSIASAFDNAHIQLPTLTFLIEFLWTWLPVFVLERTLSLLTLRQLVHTNTAIVDQLVNVAAG